MNSSADDLSNSFGNLALYDSRTAGSGNVTPVIGNNVSASALGVSSSLPRTHQAGLEAYPPLYSYNGQARQPLIGNNVSAPALAVSGSLPRTHQVGLDAYPPLHTYNVQAGDSRISRRDFLGPNLSSGTTSFRPSSYFSGNRTVSNAYLRNMIIRYVPGLTFLRLALTEQGSVQLQWNLMSDLESIALAVRLVIETLDNGIPIIFFLMVDQYGCQVVGRIVYACNQQQLAQIVDKLTLDCSLFVGTILNQYGSNLVKNLIDILHQPPLVHKIVNNLSAEFYKAMTDRHGSDVIRHCIEILEYEQNRPLYEQATRNCLPLAIHKQGCIALNEFIAAVGVQSIMQLLHLVSDEVVFLAHDEFGNFVVQNVLGLEISVFTVKMSSKLRGFYANLSMQKSGSHVVEKILRSQDGMSYAVEDLMSCKHLLQVTQHRYGNYVIQTALKVTKQANSTMYFRLLNKLEPYYVEIQSEFGKNVYNLIMSTSPQIYNCNC